MIIYNIRSLLSKINGIKSFWKQREGKSIIKSSLLLRTTSARRRGEKNIVHFRKPTITEVRIYESGSIRVK
jgi:hypothetical protein